jgi:methylenetetrahydrofolate dehydrogenase (NADP+) / methenyltetrahydrofolate cyclohydrolase
MSFIDGAGIAREIEAEQKAQVDALTRAHGRPPGLATILVGDDPASVSYVTGKQARARALGFHSLQENLPATTSTSELLEVIARCNADPLIDGILVQNPLPRQIDREKIDESVSPAKDVDCFHPENLGRLLAGRPRFLPCTPAGVVELLKRSGVALAGADVVIVGRSLLVGRPLANMLSARGPDADATVTLCHTRTRDLARYTRAADILVVAAGGSPRFITADMVKPGSVVIDVGIHRIGTSRSGKARLCGDVDCEGVSAVARLVTPVPGGVGPMTVTMLMANTIKSARLRLGG